MNTNQKGRAFESEIALELKAVGYDIVFRPPPTTRWQRHVDFGLPSKQDAGIDLVGYKNGKFRLVQCKGYQQFPGQVKRLKEALGGYWKGLALMGGEVWLVFKKPEYVGRGHNRKLVRQENVWVRCV